MTYSEKYSVKRCKKEGIMDIDERVAIEFKGWHLSPSERYWLDAGERYTGYCTPGHGDSRNEVWRPSARIEQAWMVVEKMKEEGFQFELNNGNFPEDGEEWFAQFETVDYLRGGQAFSQTAPMAICLASLEAKEIK